MLLDDMKSNVYLFYGDEPLIIKNKINYTIKDVKTSEHNVTTYDFEETKLLDIIQDASTPPFLADNKVIIIKNPLFLQNEDLINEQEKEGLKRYLSNPNESTVLIFDASNVKVSKSLSIVKLLMNKARLVIRRP